MPLFALSSSQLTAGQIALAAILALAGFVLLLPRTPKRSRSLAGGIAASIAGLAVFGSWLHTTFGNPMPDVIGSVLFGFFSVGALVFGTILVVQRNPARGAIAFAFVILSTCGLFLLLAAPFLMAATIIIYAGAIIVTFLFVLMLSHAEGPSNENDRSREPFFGSLAGFAFVGLVLFTLYLTQLGSVKAGDEDKATGKPTQRLPIQVLTDDERKTLADVLVKLEAADEKLDGDLKTPTERNELLDYFAEVKYSLSKVVGEDVAPIRYGSLSLRLEPPPGKPGEKAVLSREDGQARAILLRATAVRKQNSDAYKSAEEWIYDKKTSVSVVKANFRTLRENVLLIYGSADLPARNVGNLGYLLYADHLLAVELAGTLLLVATIGAIAIAQRKGVTA